MRYMIAFSLVMFCAIGASFAQLTWDQELVDVDAKLSEKIVSVKFPFHNTGTTPVTVTQLRTSCGCTVAKPSKDTFQPGESGEIDVDIKVGERTGRFSESVSVHTDDPNAQREVLKIHLAIPEVLELNPQLLIWGKDEPRSAKTVHIRVSAGLNVKELADPIHGGAFSLTLKTLAEGQEYELTVQPPSGSSKLAALAMLPIVLADGMTKSVAVGLVAEGADPPSTQETENPAKRKN